MKPTNTAEYLATLSDDKREALEGIRGAILAVAPGAEEGFSYDMPLLRLDEKPLMWFASWKNHYSLYPMSDAMVRVHAADIKSYETSKGTIRFPASEPLPLDLVKRLTEARVAELRESGK